MKHWPIFVAFLLLTACNSAEDVKREQYFVEGLELYKNNCANCHQLDGTGLEGLYPPISTSFIENNKAKVICLIKYGINDSLVINGKKYSQPMPANIQLEKLELAEISTYIYNKWGNETVITSIDDIEKALEKCK
jgi:mono/diheme cytochrome c family protein